MIILITYMQLLQNNMSDYTKLYNLQAQKFIIKPKSNSNGLYIHTSRILHEFRKKWSIFTFWTPENRGA